MSWNFTQKEIISIIGGIPENTLWDKLLGKDCVRTLRSSYIEIKNRRNDVMHAHNISAENYKKSKKLFQNVNNELDIAIGNYVGTIEDSITFEMKTVDFNTELGNALKTSQEFLFVPKEQIDLNGLAETLKSTDIIYSSALKERFNRKMQFQFSPEYKFTLEQIDKLKSVETELFPAIQELKKLTEELSVNKIEIPPAVLNLQKALASFSNDFDTEDNLETL